MNILEQVKLIHEAFIAKIAAKDFMLECKSRSSDKVKGMQSAQNVNSWELGKPKQLSNGGDIDCTTMFADIDVPENLPTAILPIALSAVYGGVGGPHYDIGNNPDLFGRHQVFVKPEAVSLVDGKIRVEFRLSATVHEDSIKPFSIEDLRREISTGKTTNISSPHIHGTQTNEVNVLCKSADRDGIKLQVPSTYYQNDHKDCEGTYTYTGFYSPETLHAIAKTIGGTVNDVKQTSYKDGKETTQNFTSLDLDARARAVLEIIMGTRFVERNIQITAA